jgi:Ohr subfamily peroxiredoxin
VLCRREARIARRHRHRYDSTHWREKIAVSPSINNARSVMPVNVLYTTSATATGGRDGRAVTKDGSLDVKLATPKELGGGGGSGNNPEQLFAAGYSACFLGAMKFVASQGGPKVPADTTVTATVGIGPRSEGGFGIDVGLDISLPGVPREEAEALVQKAHQVCPYSNATRNNVPVRLKVV